LLARLNAPDAAPDLVSLGDSRMLDSHLEKVSQSEVARQFGAEFVAELLKLPLGGWQGVKSGYGLHLVHVEGRTPGRLPPLAEVRDAVAREWEAVKRRETKEAHYQALLRRYTVTVEKVSLDDGTSQTVAKVR